MRATRFIFAAAVVLGSCSALELSAVAAEWEVKTPAEGGSNSCVIVSQKQAISDGYQESSIRFVVDGKAVTIQSDSVVDPSFNDIGLRVGKKEFIKADKAADKQVVFESDYANLVRLFKAGLAATVQMRFWPTWPTKGPQQASISLIGFTRAYEEARCGGQ